MPNKGKEWRRKAMEAGEAKAAKAVKIQEPTYEPELSNKKRMEMRRATRAYNVEKQAGLKT